MPVFEMIDREIVRAIVDRRPPGRSAGVADELYPTEIYHAAVRRAAGANRVNHGSRKRGRPSKFRPEFVVLARRLRERFDATTDDVAGIIGVDPSTLRGWARECAEFRSAMQTAPYTPNCRSFCYRTATDALAAVIERRARRHGTRLPAEDAGVIRAVVATALTAWRDGVGSEIN